MLPENDPKLSSWLESANAPDADFPIQNLPFGVFSSKARGLDPRVGVAIGDRVLDMKGAVEAGLLKDVSPAVRCALSANALNDLMSQGPGAAREARRAASRLLRSDTPTLRDDEGARETLLVPMAEATMHVPARIGDYTDFYASVHHATNVGSMFRPDNPLLPNYKYLPVGYHGRASSIVVSGTPLHRPKGQVRPDEGEPPVYAPSRLLDYEMEMGAFVARGNALGRPVPMAEAEEHLFGMTIVNDWSARDIQKWEYQPLGPFNAKNFGTTISPWVVTLDALEPYRSFAPPRNEDDPDVLDYLEPRTNMVVDITVEVWLASQTMREKKIAPVRLSRGNFRDMYWTIAQMLVHHTSTGCNLRPGDLLASGTVSGPTESARGCLLELTWRGQNPIQLPDGTTRKFLQDGDEVIMRAYCQKTGAARIGFGECRGTILPAT